jgi:hypothetical protein
MGLEKLKSLFPRNYNIEKSDKLIYNKLEQSNEIFKDKSHKDIFMIALALGYKNKLPKKMKKSYPLVNCSSFSSRDCWVITAIAVEEKGMAVLSDMLEIRKIAEGYANAGFEILQKKLYEEKPGNVLNHLEAEMIEMLPD